MARGITFGEFNTVDDWGLCMSAKKVPLPAPKTTYVSVPGRDGDIDMTEALDGVVHYDDRPASFTFELLEGTVRDRIGRIDKIIKALHGKMLQIVDQDDYPGYYLVGRVTVDEVKHTKAYTTVKISATCRPWRFAKTEKNKTIVLSALARTVVIDNRGDMPVHPTLTVTGTLILEYGTTSVTLEAGTYILPGFRFVAGVNTIKVSGSGSLTITFREGIF